MNDDIFLNARKFEFFLPTGSMVNIDKRNNAQKTQENITKIIKNINTNWCMLSWLYLCHYTVSCPCRCHLKEKEIEWERKRDKKKEREREKEAEAERVK